MIGHRFDPNTPISETVSATRGYFFPIGVDNLDRCKHSTMLSKLDMCATLACHLAGLGSVSVLLFRCYHLIPYTSSSPGDAEYGSPFCPGAI